jgi:hypothetical protein
MSSQSESVAISVRQYKDWWEWVVTDTASQPPFRLGAGLASDRESAWADAASVVNDLAEDQEEVAGA